MEQEVSQGRPTIEGQLTTRLYLHLFPSFLHNPFWHQGTLYKTVFNPKHAFLFSTFLVSLIYFYLISLILRRFLIFAFSASNCPHEHTFIPQQPFVGVQHGVLHVMLIFGPYALTAQLLTLMGIILKNIMSLRLNFIIH